MNKAINLLLLLLGIVTTNIVLPQEYKFKQNEPIKLPPFNLEDEVKGQLKRVEFIRFGAQEIFGEIKPTEIIEKRIWYFNSDNQVEKIEYYKKDSLRGVSNYFYLSDEGYDNMIIFEGEDKKEYHYRIDTNGMVTFLDYLKNGELIKKEIATYDSKKRMLSYQCFEGNGKKIEEKNFTYDLKGNIIRADYGVGIEKETAFFKFQNGKQIETKILNQVGELIWKKNVVFNPKGEFSSSITQINSAGEVYYLKTVNSVIDIGTVLVKYYEGESLTNLKLYSDEKIINKSNEFGGITTIYIEMPNKTVLVANKNGMVLEKLFYQGGKLLTKEINKYDLKGNLISNENINFCNSTDCEIEPSLEYKTVKYIDFDANDNCTKVIRTHQKKDGKQLSQSITIEETKIEYAK